MCGMYRVIIIVFFFLISMPLGRSSSFEYKDTPQVATEYTSSSSLITINSPYVTPSSYTPGIQKTLRVPVKTYINMHIIETIESTNNPRAYNPRSGARGLYQITKIVLDEWNVFHPLLEYTLHDLFIPHINQMIAHWYMNVRIPHMLAHFQKADTVRNRLIAWNAGIAYVVKNLPLPKETTRFIARYFSLAAKKTTPGVYTPGV